MTNQKRIYSLYKGLDSLSKEEHGLFFDAVQRLELSNEVKHAAVALYLDFKSRPVGEYNAERKNLEIFLVGSVSLAAKALGELRTDQEFESKMFVDREKLIDAEERILRSLSVQNSVMPYSEFVHQLTERQIESMADGFARRGLIDNDDREQLLQVSSDYLAAAVKNGLNPGMSYRGRAAGVVLRAIRDLDLQISQADIARAAGFDKSSMTVNANIIRGLVNHSNSNPREENPTR